MGVRRRPESRTFYRNSPNIIALLTGGGVRIVARSGEPRHANRTTPLVGWRARQRRPRPMCVWWGGRA